MAVLPPREHFGFTATQATAIGVAMAREIAAAKIRLLSARSPGRDAGVASTESVLEEIRERYWPLFSRDEQAEIPLGGRTLTDSGFAAQRLSGSAPYTLRRLEALPPHLRVSDEDLRGVLPDGANLLGLIRARELFCVETHSMFAGALGDPSVVRAHIRAAPTTLYRCDPLSGALRPIAIQLLPEPARAHPNPILTPSSAPPAWLAAKLLTNQSESAAHVAGFHTMGVYAFAQAVVAMRRTMSTRHPLHAFCEPWMTHVLGTVTLTRMSADGTVTMKSPEGPLGGNFWREFRLEDFELPWRMKARGLDALPDFPWRDHMLAIWGALEGFTREVVWKIYEDDATLLSDPEAQAFASALQNQCKLRSDALGAGEFATRESLVRVLTTLNFFLSVWHGFDRANWAWFAWIPSTPLALSLELPNDSSTVTFDQVLGALPAAGALSSLAQRAGVLAASRSLHASALTSGGPSAGFVPPIDGYLEGLPGAAELTRNYFARLEEIERNVRISDAERARKGQERAPRGCAPSLCFGNILG
jgi:Lipoxygenase